MGINVCMLLIAMVLTISSVYLVTLQILTYSSQKQLKIILIDTICDKKTDNKFCRYPLLFSEEQKDFLGEISRLLSVSLDELPLSYSLYDLSCIEESHVSNGICRYACKISHKNSSMIVSEHVFNDFIKILKSFYMDDINTPLMIRYFGNRNRQYQYLMSLPLYELLSHKPGCIDETLLCKTLKSRRGNAGNEWQEA